MNHKYQNKLRITLNTDDSTKENKVYRQRPMTTGTKSSLVPFPFRGKLYP